MTSIPGKCGPVPRRRVPPRVLGSPHQGWGLTVASLCVALLVLGASGASAVWHGFATGSGSAETSPTAPVVLSPGAPTSALLPGATADVALTVSNPNPASLHIGSLTLDRTQGTRGIAVDGDHAGCGVSAVRFASQSNNGAGWTVPGRVGTVDGTASVTLVDAVGMDTSASDACQGAVFNVYLTAGP